HVEIGKPDPKQTHPRPQHVALIQTADAAVSLITGRSARKLIAKSADQMPERMTTKGITAKKNNIDGEHDRSEADSKCLAARRRVSKPTRLPDVIGKDSNKNNGHIEEVAMNVLHDERERPLAQISLPWLAYGASRGVRPERLIISPSIIIA